VKEIFAAERAERELASATYVFACSLPLSLSRNLKIETISIAWSWPKRKTSCVMANRFNHVPLVPGFKPHRTTEFHCIRK
jgi:hypothetical protein